MFDFIPAGFHFIRPEWLFALIPAVLFFALFLIMNIESNQWSRAVSRDLLPHLLDGGKSAGRNGLLAILLAAWTIASFAMAGPAWEKLPQPVHEIEDALVIIQDLSLSFFAQDLSPDRMTRARRKLVDILKQRKEGTTALIAYSADAHTIVPLTDDIRTIENMVPALSPSIMPGYGSNVVAGVGKGFELLKNGASGHGRMLLITDEVTADDIEEINDILNGRSINISVIGVGTENGGPVPQKDGGFWKDKDGTIIVPKMDRSLLRRLAEDTGGRYSDITLTDSDIEYVLAEETRIVPQSDLQRLEREFDTWQDMGSRLVVLIIPLALMAFRRGLIIGILFFIVLTSGDCHAMSWQDLWLTRDQQAARAMKENDFNGAADAFKKPDWKGAAQYRAGEYEKAAQSFSGIEGADNFYNLGNSLARGGKLNEAITAYDRALEIDPSMKDAHENRQLVEKILKEQEQQQNKEKSKENQQGEEDQSSNGDDSQSESQSQKNEKEDEQEKKEQQGDEQNKQSDGSSGDDEQKADDLKSREEQKKDKEQNSSEEKDKPSQSFSEEEKGKNESDGQEGEAISEVDKLSEEEQQAVEQLLRKIPDDPGGLLRRKFEYEFQQNQGRIKSNKNNKIW